jgi:hypothetical protein
MTLFREETLMRTRLLVLILAAAAVPAQAPAAGRKAVKPASAHVFGLDKVWSIHLTIQPQDWDKMQPTRGRGGFGGFGPPRPDQRPDRSAAADRDRRPHGGFGFDYAYVKGKLEIDGKTYKDVGVRFKGNFTFAASQGRLKRPFKISLARYVPGQSFKGFKKLTLNNNIADPTCAREVLSYGVYHTLEVPASRTAYAEMTLSVPGKYAREFVGLYTLVEPVDKTFLKNRFGSARGLLLKPEGGGPLDYLGEEWAPYERTYKPKTTASKKAQRRLIEFTRLVQKADDRTFAREIGDYLDVDEFLRFLSGTVALSSMDSFIGFGHNYYLYLNPRTNKFAFLPWDFDLSFGAMMMMGSPRDFMDLSIRQPYTNRNRLIERLLADPKVFAAYQGNFKKLIEKGYTREGVRKDLATINAAIGPAREKEKKAMGTRRERGQGFGSMPGPAPDLAAFVGERVASIQGQLAGKRKGTVLAGRFGPPIGPPRGGGPGQFLVRPILDAADKDKDGKLSKAEVTAAAKALFKALDKEGQGMLDEKALAGGIDKLLPGPRGFAGPRGFPGPGAALAKAVVQRAGTKGQVTEASLVAAADKVFNEADKNKDGKLDEKELAEALSKVMPQPQFGPPMGGGFGPGQILARPILATADKDRDGKLSKAEVKAAAKALFKALDKEGKGELDEKGMARGLDRLFPAPRGFGGPPRGFPGPGAGLAKVIVARAGKKGMVTEARLIAAADKLFAEAVKEKGAKLDEKKLAEVLNKLLLPPQFWPPRGAPFGPPPDRPRDRGPAKNQRQEGGK